MTFLNDLWKKFKTAPITQNQNQSKSASDVSVLEKKEIKQRKEFNEVKVVKQTKEVKEAKEVKKSEEQSRDLSTKAILEAFQQNELESLQLDSVYANLQSLKNIVNQPKEEAPGLRFSKINQHLGTPETYETVRHERWQEICCPKCKSTHLKRIAQVPPQSSHNHRYHCLDCDTVFNDDTGTPLARGLPPLNVWMQCWYLLGCTDSLNYIAAKLGLDLPTVEVMVRQLQKTFNAKQPLVKLKNFEEWSKQSQPLRVQLKHDLLEQYERLNANIATVPKDTAEHRRQENLRRDPSLSTPPGTRKTR